MSDREHRDLVGHRFGNYVITRQLGEGGMGAVYQARHPEIEREVAIKVLAPHLAHHPNVAKRFVAEARAVTRVKHPNVIEIYDFGRDPQGELYIIMELLQGRELMAVLDAQRRMAPRQVLPFLEQICGALQAAHDHNVIHRDLKPENIFVLDCSPLTVKILDFGIAKLLEDDSGRSLTATGMVIGSPMTIAPEQAVGQKDRIGPQTDLYSLGVILYWMLAGRPPFQDKPTALLLADHVKEPAPALTSLAPDLPRPIAGLVHRCLEKHPADRPASATEIAREFARHAGAAIPPTQVAAGQLAKTPTLPPQGTAFDDTLAASQLANTPTLPPQGTAFDDTLAATGSAVLPDDEDAPTIEVPAQIPPTVGVPVTRVASRSPARWIALGAGGAVVLVGALATLLFTLYRGGQPDDARSRKEYTRQDSTQPARPDLSVAAWAALDSRTATAPEKTTQEQAAAHFDMGRQYVGLKEYEKAVAAFRRALELRPKSCRITGELGWAAFLAGDLHGATQHTNAALRLCQRPEERAAMLYNLGRIAEAGGDGDAAAKHYQHSLKLRPSKVVESRLKGLSRRQRPASSRRPRHRSRVIAGIPYTEGKLDKRTIRRAIRRYINQVRQCYARGLAKTPQLYGRVVVKFTIAASGRVVASSVSGSTVPDDEVGYCIARSARNWNFPRPRGGVVIVEYPFVLRTTN